MISGLKGRLNRIAATMGTPPADAAVKADAQAAEPAEKSPAEPAGDCMVLRADYPIDEAAQRATADDLIDICGEDGAISSSTARCFSTPRPRGFRAARGTVAFLVGLGWIECGRFIVEQYFLRDYSEEEAMLRRFGARIERCTHIVTYNGKSFDVPLMQDRFTLAHMRAAFDKKRHIDLIHPARRVWKLRLERCSLGALEECVLGVKRDIDIPGSEVPQRYFEYLKTRDFARMNEVIEHNRQDIVTLMLLLGKMAELFRSPFSAGYSEDIYSIGRALQRGGDKDRALECFRATAQGSMAGRASESMSMLLKKERELSAAMSVWLDMERRNLGGLMPYIELSKAYEHHLKDYESALRHADMGYSLARAMRDERGMADLKHRAARISGKLSGPAQAKLQSETEQEDF